MDHKFYEAVAMEFGNGTVAVMAKPNDRHKPGARMVRINPRLCRQAEALADRLAHDFTQVINDAVRERLEREGLWPPAEPETRRQRKGS